MDKTNVMRVLDQKKISYVPHCYEETGETNGVKIAEILGQDVNKVFKTLVTFSDKSKKNYVFVIPVAEELDLKKAAKAVGEKSIEMLKQKDLLPLTGYVHGGCSPIGMKKLFPTVFHSTAETYEQIYFSGGKVGYQVQLHLEDIKKIIPYKVADLVVE